MRDRDESEPVAIVTGANAGIGRAIARGLLQRGRRVVLACRSRVRALEAATEMTERTGRAPEIGARIFGKSPERAADTALWLATSDEVAGVSGGYLQDRSELGCAYTCAADEDALHALCDAQTEADAALAALAAHIRSEAA